MPAVDNVGVLGILAADLEDGVDFRVEIHGCSRMSADLVVNAPGQGVQPGDLPSRTGDAEPDDLRPARQLLLQGGVAGLGGLDGISQRFDVHRGQDAVVALSHQHRLGGGRAHIEAEDEVSGLTQSCSGLHHVPERHPAGRRGQSRQNGERLGLGHKYLFQAVRADGLIIQRPQG